MTDRSRRSLQSPLVLSLAIGLLMASPAAADAQGATERYMIQYRAGKADLVEGELARKRTRRLRHMRRSRIMAAHLTQEEARGLTNSLNVERVELDVRRYPSAESRPYGIDLIQAHAAQLDVSGSTPRTVCVIDSGYDTSHPDLPNSRSFVTGNAQPGTGAWDSPGDSHGTHVAGTIAALANDVGVVGVDRSPGLQLHIVKVFDDEGEWTYSSDLIAAVESCVDAGAHVINMSLGGGAPSSIEEAAFIDAATPRGGHPGTLSIAAAGNSGDTSRSYPASYESVISVAAVDSQKAVATFSQRNAAVELAAPGVGVLSTVPGGGYASYSGTSMATPHVAGAASLLWGLHPACSPTQIRNALALSAEDLGAAGRDHEFGYGLIQVAEADDLIRAGGCDAVGEPTPAPPANPAPNPETPVLENGATVRDLVLATGQKQYFKVPVALGAQNLSIRMTGGTGDADLYLRGGALPSTGTYDCRSWAVGNDEACRVFEPTGPTDYYVMVHAYDDFSGASLAVDYDTAIPDEVPTARIIASSLSGPAPLTVTFDGSASSDDRGITAYQWDFSEGPSSTSPGPLERTYSTPGQHTATLTVTDTAGQIHSTTVAISVEEPVLSSPISLQITPGKKSRRVHLWWEGASGRKVTVYRNGVRAKRTRNKGKWRDKRSPAGATYQVCDAEDCSPIVERP